MTRSAALAVIFVLIASSLTSVGYASAQMQKPQVPQFTLAYQDNSYEEAPQATVDQYTGQTVLTGTGTHVDGRVAVFTITNQQFTPYTDSSGNLVKLYYNFRFKGPYGTEWSYYPDSSHSYGPYGGGKFPDTSASRTQTTTITIRLADLTRYPSGTPTIPANSKVEFQVQAIEGYIVTNHTGMLAGDYMGYAGEESDWSSTAILIVGDGGSAAQPTPTTSSLPSTNQTVVPVQQYSSPEQTQTFDWRDVAIAVLAAALVLAASVAVLARRKLCRK